MKNLLISFIMILAFFAIYYWAKFEEKATRFLSMSGVIDQTAKFIRQKWARSSKRSCEPQEDLAVGDSNQNHLDSDFESFKKTVENVEPVEAAEPLDLNPDFPVFAKTIEEIFEKQALKKRQFEKLLKLANKAKAVPKVNNSQSKSLRNKGRSVSVSVLSRQERLQLKLNFLEKTIKQRRRGRALETIPESLLSKDSFSN